MCGKRRSCRNVPEYAAKKAMYSKVLWVLDYRGCGITNVCMFPLNWFPEPWLLYCGAEPLFEYTGPPALLNV